MLLAFLSITFISVLFSFLSSLLFNFSPFPFPLEDHCGPKLSLEALDSFFHLDHPVYYNICIRCMNDIKAVFLICLSYSMSYFGRLDKDLLAELTSLFCPLFQHKTCSASVSVLRMHKEINLNSGSYSFQGLSIALLPRINILDGPY